MIIIVIWLYILPIFIPLSRIKKKSRNLKKLSCQSLPFFSIYSTYPGIYIGMEIGNTTKKNEKVIYLGRATCE